MEKRVLLAIGLSALILFVYQMLFYKPPVKSPEKAHLTKELSISSTGTQAVSVTPQPAKEEIVILPEEDLQIKTNLLEVKLDNYGKLKAWKLLNFGERDGRRVDLIPPPLEEPPLSLYLGGKELVPVDFESPSSKIKRFIYQVGNLKISKQFTFGEDTYIANLDIVIENQSSQDVQVLDASGFSLRWEAPSLEAKELTEAQRYYSHLDTIEQTCLVNQKKQVITHKKAGILDGILSFLGFIPEPKLEDESKREVGSIDWVSQSSKYFLNVIIPKTPFKEVIFHRTKDGQVSIEMPLSGFVLQGGQNMTTSFRLYGGPKDYKILETISSSLSKLTGMWIVPIVILWILNFFYHLTYNYGVAIILLTIIVKIILHPLTKKNYKVMKNMQKIQPDMAKLKEKHKDDKEALNREIMDLYKRHKVNPLGGCLPLLLQMPIFFALFNTLSTAIELRGAGFIFWIQDLSSKDPFYILPILMGATMIIQQKMTPSADPNQAKMGMFMSIIFIFMFMSFPSGVVLYWFVQNILTIGEQFLINKGLEK